MGCFSLFARRTEMNICAICQRKCKRKREAWSFHNMGGVDYNLYSISWTTASWIFLKLKRTCQTCNRIFVRRTLPKYLSSLKLPFTRELLPNMYQFVERMRHATRNEIVNFRIHKSFYVASRYWNWQTYEFVLSQFYLNNRRSTVKMKRNFSFIEWSLSKPFARESRKMAT